VLTVIGEALIDLVASRYDPAQFRALPGGSPLNVAVGLARLGAPTTMMCRLSRDHFGRALRGHASANGVDLGVAVDANEPTTLAIASLDDAGEASYSFYVEGTADWQWSHQELERVPADTTILHAGSAASWLAPSGSRIAAVLAAHRRGGQVLISYDPNVRPSLINDPAAARDLIERDVRVAGLVKASDEDLQWLYPSRDPVDSARAWSRLGPALVVLTRGAEGSVAVRADGREMARPARSAAVVDAVGAGDSFMAALLATIHFDSLADGGQLNVESDAVLAALLDTASTAAALTCERVGADPPTRAQLATARRTGTE
jgi:fructokinase